MRRADTEFIMVGSAREARDAWRSRYDDWRQARQYRLVLAGDDSVPYCRDYVPGPSIVLAILLFPIGLIALIIRSTALFVIHFDDRGDGFTHVRAHGRAGRTTRRTLAELSVQVKSAAASSGAVSGELF